jgi:DNA-binding NarL/FixJ family response regulator
MMKILFTGDQPLLLERLQNLLITQDYEVAVTTGSSREALAKAQEFKPEVLLMNIFKQESGGLETTRLIKAILPKCQIILLMSAEDDESLFEAMNSGVSAYLLNSLQSEELFNLLTRLERI